MQSHVVALDFSLLFEYIFLAKVICPAEVSPLCEMGPVLYLGIQSLFLCPWHLQLKFSIVFIRRCTGTLFVLAVGSVKHDSPYKQHVAEWRNLPGVVHRGLHVVLPSMRCNTGLFTPKAPLPFASARSGRLHCPLSFSFVCSCLPSRWSSR